SDAVQFRLLGITVNVEELVGDLAAAGLDVIVNEHAVLIAASCLRCAGEGDNLHRGNAGVCANPGNRLARFFGQRESIAFGEVEPPLLIAHNRVNTYEHGNHDDGDEQT